MRRRVAQVFVMVDAAEQIIGFYSLSAATFDRGELPVQQAKKLPHYPVPAAILGRLAVHSQHHGKRHGETLLLDAVRRVLRASEAIGIHAVIVDAKNEGAARFYGRYGFVQFSNNPRRLVLPLETFVKAGL
jgi:GNAT superfamily N-acetyltransferase